MRYVPVDTLAEASALPGQQAGGEVISGLCMSEAYLAVAGGERGKLGVPAGPDMDGKDRR